jgi:peptide/nickel transport system ATP-binding protein
MTPLLSVRDLRVGFGAVPALAGARLEVRSGQTVALVGQSGSGKSTLARAVVGLLPKTATVLGGEIEFDGRSLLGLTEPALRAIRGRHIALVAQDPAAALNPVVPIGTQVAETLRIHGLARRGQADDLAVGLLTAAGLPEARTHLRRYPHELSGGMIRRVLVAMATMSSPRLLLADEPTTGLPAATVRTTLAEFRQMADAGCAVVLVTHELLAALEVADRVVICREGRTVDAADPAAFTGDGAALEHPYTRALWQALPANGFRVPTAAGI